MVDLREWHHAQDGHVNTQKLKHDNYKLGWICADQIELTAARAMLNSVHDPLPDKMGDNNSYVLGEIMEHNVVIACLPTGYYGTNSAAIVAANMVRSFPFIEGTLLVGVGGGAPGRADIRLGDVVIGTEIIQYDTSDMFAGGLQRGRPPRTFMSAIAQLRSIHAMQSSNVPDIISDMVQRYPRLATFGRRPDFPDKLYSTECLHEMSANVHGCENCDPSQVVNRPPRDSNFPEFHYGRIGSGPQVIKDGHTRDGIALRLDVFCFDTEASGIMDRFPCLIIRGICDYADSHRNDIWREYAAANAAAYAKELIKLIPRKRSSASSIDWSTYDQELPLRQTDRLLNPHIPFLTETYERNYNKHAELLIESPQGNDSPEESRAAFRKPMRPYGSCRISLKIEDEQISQFGVDALKHRVFPGNGLPLAEIFEKYTLTMGEKFALGHAVSLAFWQLYNSQFISTSWNSRALWLMLDRDPQSDPEHSRLISYLSFRPETAEGVLNTLNPNKTRPPDDSSPQVQSLSILLLEIGLGRTFRSHAYDKRGSKSTWGYSVAMEYLDELKSTNWDANAQRNIFADTVRECMEFSNSEIRAASSEIGPLRTPPRAFLYDRVITRLGEANRLFQKRTTPTRYMENPQLSQVNQHLGAHASSIGVVSLADVSHSDMKNQPAKHIRPINRFDFKVAIFCALTLEADAIEAIFDHQWDIEGNGYGKSDGDHNAYSLGSIGSHNVVLAYMPGMGKGNAASVAANCRISFPNIKLAIVAGVCGVVPFAPGSRDEIILGDVVLSDGIIQYDFGKKLPQGFERKDDILDSLGRPQASVRALIAKLKGLRTRRLMLDRMASYLADLQNDTDLKANYPGAQHDRLFESKYEHIKNGILCQDCGCNGTLVPRQRIAQDITSPAVHFGLIASGDLVMKSGKERDDISREESIIGFEMEGAGVWDNFPCLVIKGACDYADSHKPQAWQRYAAATAATCTKAVLHHWQP